MFWYPLLNEKTIMIDILNRFSDLSSREYQAVTDLCVFKMLYWWLFHQYSVLEKDTSKNRTGKKKADTVTKLNMKIRKQHLLRY